MEHTIKDGLVAGFGPGEIVYDADKDADNLGGPEDTDVLNDAEEDEADASSDVGNRQAGVRVGGFGKHYD